MQGSTRAKRNTPSPGPYSFTALGNPRPHPRKLTIQGFGLNLAVVAITVWNTVYLGRAVDHLRSQGEVIDDTVLAHIAPLGWEHTTFNGDYVWWTEPLQFDFRPLRNPRSAFLDPA
jgi:Tn3 transposase DDE domain